MCEMCANWRPGYPLQPTNEGTWKTDPRYVNSGGGKTAGDDARSQCGDGATEALSVESDENEGVDGILGGVSPAGQSSPGAYVPKAGIDWECRDWQGFGNG